MKQKIFSNRLIELMQVAFLSIIANVFFCQTLYAESALDKTDTIYQGDFYNVDSQNNYDYFGSSMATGDLDGDGAIDLVIGVPGETIGNQKGAGAIHIIYGENTINGMYFGKHADDVLHFQGDGTVPGESKAYDQFGYAVAVGDFNWDGFDDIAVGAPYSTADGVSKAGAVYIIYGHESRNFNSPKTPQNQMIHQNSTNKIPTSPEYGDRFGFSLAVGNFDGSTFINTKDDLVVGAPDEDYLDIQDAGAVYVFYGSAQGIDFNKVQEIHQNSPYIDSSCEPGDKFGFSLAVGDFNYDYVSDLAIGVPYEDVYDKKDAGAVHVIFGEYQNKLLLSSEQNLTPASSNVIGEAGKNDNFGYSLAAFSLYNDYYNTPESLAVGIPYKDVDGESNAGMIHIFRGNSYKPLTYKQVRISRSDVSGLGSLSMRESFGKFLTRGYGSVHLITGTYGNGGYYKVMDINYDVGTESFSGGYRNEYVGSYSFYNVSLASAEASTYGHCSDWSAFVGFPKYSSGGLTYDGIAHTYDGEKLGFCY